MKEDITKEMENEIKSRKKLSKEAKTERDKKVFRNLIFAILVIIYFIFINLGYYNLDKTVFVRDTAIFSMVTLAIAIILFEKSYKTEKGYLAIHGIEVLVASIFTYFIPYTYFNFGELTSKLCMLIPIAFAIYFCVKAIAICIKANSKRESDIKDIVKKEERKNDDAWVKIDKDKEAEIEEKRPNEEAKKIEETKPKKEKKAKQKEEEKNNVTNPKRGKNNKEEKNDKIEKTEKKPRKKTKKAEEPKLENREIKEDKVKAENIAEEEPKKKASGRHKKVTIIEETKSQEIEENKTTKTNKKAKAKKETDIKTETQKRTRKKKEE